MSTSPRSPRSTRPSTARASSTSRDSFERIRQARTQDDTEFADAELSPELAEQLRNVVAGDVASHRHHLLPGLEIRSAVIESASVTDGKMIAVVRYHLESEEIDVDENGTVVAGDYREREWDEDWTFWRDPAVDASDIDRALTFVPMGKGGWLFAHRGWLVTHIERLGGPDPLDPTNL